MVSCAHSKNRPVKALPLLARLLTLLVLVSCWTLSTPAQAKPRGTARIAVDAHTGETLYASRSQVRWNPASLTKMMTLYQLFTALQRRKLTMNSSIKVSRRAARQPPSKLGLRVGNTIKVRTAIEALAVKSANDVAVAVAEKLAGSEVAFAKQMNKTARYLGMSRTNFRNASGLHHSKQITTARDMAILSVALMRDFPEYYKYFSQKSFRFGKRRYNSHNRILKQYSGADGLKTGYIAASGFNLAASAVQNGKRVVAVVLGANSSNHRTALMKRLLNSGFGELQNTSRRRIARPLPIRLLSTPPVPRPRGGTRSIQKREPVLEQRPRYVPIPRLDPRGNPDGTASVAAVKEQKPATKKAITVASAVGNVPIPRRSPRSPSLVQTAARSSSADGNFAIQVGAYRSHGLAEKQLTRVLGKLPSAHKQAEPLVLSIRGRSNRVLYRARLTGYEERGTATATCNWLKARKTDCMVVQSSS